VEEIQTENSDASPQVTEFWGIATRELGRLGFLIAGNFAPVEVEPDNDERFSEAEQREITLRLDEIRETLLQQYELDQEQSTWLRNEVDLLKEEIKTSRKITWRHLARSVMLGIASMIGGQSGRLVAEQAYEMLRPYLGRWFPFLLGSG
jgi:hypothetical protein